MRWSLQLFTVINALFSVAVALTSYECLDDNGPCKISNSLQGSCEGPDNLPINATCLCQVGWIPVENLCIQCKKDTGDSGPLLDDRKTFRASMSSKCSSSKVHIATIPAEIKSQLSTFSATRSKASSTKTKGATGIATFSDAYTDTYSYELPWTSLHTRTFHGGQDATPTGWLTDTRNPADVIATETAKSSMADSNWRQGTMLNVVGVAIAATLYYL